MNNWSDEEKACALTSILRDSAAAILENLSSSDILQSLAKRAFVNSLIETQEYVAARRFDEGIADLDVQRIVRLSSPRTLQDALVKALEIKAATKGTRMTGRVRSVEEDHKVEVRATLFTSRKRSTYQTNPPFRTSLEANEKKTGEELMMIRLEEQR
nr:unnamed protein product [Callosobruchus chinensis]